GKKYLNIPYGVIRLFGPGYIKGEDIFFPFYKLLGEFRLYVFPIVPRGIEVHAHIRLPKFGSLAPVKIIRDAHCGTAGVEIIGGTLGRSRPENNIRIKCAQGVGACAIVLKAGILYQILALCKNAVEQEWEKKIF